MDQHDLTILPHGASLRGVGGTCIRDGSTFLRASTSTGRSRVIEALVLSSPEFIGQFFVSWHDLVALGYLPAFFPHHPDETVHLRPSQVLARAASEGQAQRTRTSLIAEFAPSVLSDLLHERPMSVGGPMKIELTPNARPVYCSAPRKVPVRFEAEAEATIEELLRKGVIARH